MTLQEEEKGCQDNGSGTVFEWLMSSLSCLFSALSWNTLGTTSYSMRKAGGNETRQKFKISKLAKSISQ
jgi:hypothetical protein